MHRALWEFRVRGVATNLRFLDQIITHPRFAQAQYTTSFIDETPELFAAPQRRDRATRILTYLAETVVNGNAEVAGRPAPERLRAGRRSARRACRRTHPRPTVRRPAAGSVSRHWDLSASRNGCAPSSACC